VVVEVVVEKLVVEVEQVVLENPKTLQFLDLIQLLL
jgi:hypothetical protein